MLREKSVTPKRGHPLRKTPRQYQERFDKKYGPGAALEFLRLCQTGTYAAAGASFGFTRQRAQQFYRALTGGARKPKPQGRLDVTPEKIRELAKGCGSIREIAEKLSTSPSTVTKRARRYRIRLPNALLLRQEKRQVLCRAILKLARRGVSVPEMALRLGIKAKKIYKYNKQYGLSLPLRPYP